RRAGSCRQRRAHLRDVEAGHARPRQRKRHGFRRWQSCGERLPAGPQRAHLRGVRPAQGVGALLTVRVDLTPGARPTFSRGDLTYDRDVADEPTTRSRRVTGTDLAPPTVPTRELTSLSRRVTSFTRSTSASCI